MGLQEDLLQINKKYYKSDAILGKNALTLANHLNSSRAFMFASMLDQTVCPEFAEYPLVSTGYEKLIGKYSSALNKAKSNFTVIDKISKFPFAPNAVYTLIVFNNQTEEYDLIERKSGEKLTETYGYKYITPMDKYEPGDTIHKNDVLYYSTSFQENGNLWGYGKNALVMYTTDPMTIEDPIRMRKGFAESFTSIEYDTVKIALNDNDLLINLYGDDNEYKAFPDIGEKVKDSRIAVRRRISYASALFDLKESNMKKIMTTDTPFYVPFAEDTVIDVKVYCNNPEGIPDNKFNSQIKKYYEAEMNYYQELYNILDPIINDPEKKFSNKLSFVYSQVKDIIDPEVKWKEKNNKIFNNIIIELEIEKRVGTIKGSKFAGRYGNKGVISEISSDGIVDNQTTKTTLIDDNAMPIVEDGRPIDIIINILGVGNRLNSGQLNEVELTFQAEEIRKMMAASSDRYVQETLMFDFLDIVSPLYSKELRDWYDKLNEDEKDEFITNTINDHIYIEQPPMDNAGFKEFCKVYDEFGIKPLDVYVNKFGKRRKIMNKLVVGYQYFIKLKHHPKSKSSARSTGYLNSKDLPIKTTAVQDNKSILQTTAIKIGDMEALNLLLNNNPDAFMKLNMLYASSPIARRDIGQIYENGVLDNIKINKDAKNRNVEIFDIDNKMMGIRLKFVKKKKDD